MLGVRTSEESYDLNSPQTLWFLNFADKVVNFLVDKYQIVYEIILGVRRGQT